MAKSLNQSWDDVRSATQYSPNCLSYVIEEQGHKLSEDCLYVNVVRPSRVADTAELPVAFWIHSGGFTTGGSAYARYNLSFIVEQSVKIGTPIVAVSFNYRLSAYGFLSGGEATEAGISNNGYRDQRLALQWVNENIAAFGGSPDKVTIWGESAGAMSVTAHMFAYNGTAVSYPPLVQRPSGANSCQVVMINSSAQLPANPASEQLSPALQRDSLPPRTPILFTTI